MNVRILKCYFIALIEFFKYGSFVPHTFRDVECKKTIIIATDDSFRVSDNYRHEENETVYSNALLVTSRCSCCGKEIQSWYKDPWMYNVNDLWEELDKCIK